MLETKQRCGDPCLGSLAGVFFCLVSKEKVETCLVNSVCGLVKYYMRGLLNIAVHCYLLSLCLCMLNW